MAAKKKTAKKKTTKRESKQVEVLDQSDPKFLPTQYNMTEAAIAKLREEYDPALIPDTENKGDDGYLIVHEKAMAIVKYRTGVEKKRKELKSNALSWGRLVDSKAKELTEIIEEIEKPWKDLKTDLDEKEAREAEDARIKEVERIQEIENRVSTLQLATSNLVGANVAALKGVLKLLSDTVIDESYGEYAEAAQFHRDTGIGKLDTAIAEREIFEEQQAQVKRDQEAIAAAQKDVDDKAAELDRVRQENEQAAADKMAEQQKKMDEQQALLDKQKAAQEKTEADEKKRKEDEAFAELEEKQRKEKEAADAEAKKVRDAELYKRLPEDVKLRKYADALIAVEPPAVKDKELNEVIIDATLNLGHLVSNIYTNTQGE